MAEPDKRKNYSEIINSLPTESVFFSTFILSLIWGFVLKVLGDGLVIRISASDLGGIIGAAILIMIPPAIIAGVVSIVKRNKRSFMPWWTGTCIIWGGILGIWFFRIHVWI